MRGPSPSEVVEEAVPSDGGVAVDLPSGTAERIHSIMCGGEAATQTWARVRTASGLLVWQTCGSRSPRLQSKACVTLGYACVCVSAHKYTHKKVLGCRASHPAQGGPTRARCRRQDGADIAAERCRGRCCSMPKRKTCVARNRGALVEPYVFGMFPCSEQIPNTCLKTKRRCLLRAVLCASTGPLRGHVAWKLSGRCSTCSSNVFGVAESATQSTPS